MVFLGLKTEQWPHSYLVTGVFSLMCFARMLMANFITTEGRCVSEFDCFVLEFRKGVM
jgi:hypothetical protein